MAGEKPTEEEIAKWDRWFAIEFNNLAWTLAEKEDRTAEEAERMLLAAHAAALHWERVGTEKQRAMADLLLAHALALRGQGEAAMPCARRCLEFISAADGAGEWEAAFAHGVMAHAAAAAGEQALCEEHRLAAKQMGESLADADERALFLKMFRAAEAAYERLLHQEGKSIGKGGASQ